MAILTVDQLVELRQRLARVVTRVSWTKAEGNAALQAVEDWFEANRASLGAAIETAAPGLFTVAQKKALVAYWLLQKATREGI